MANTFTPIVDKIFGMSLMALREFAIMPRLVNTDFSAEVAQQGDTIDIKVPSAMTVGDVAPSQTPPAGQDVAPTTVQVSLSKWRSVEMHITDKEAREVADGAGGTVSLQLSEAMKAIANDVDSYVLGFYTGVYGYTGTAATTPFGSDLDDAINARKVLADQLAPTDPRRIVLDPAAEANALGNRAIQDATFRANQRNTLLTGEIGTVLGFDWFTDQNIPTHTTVAAGTILVDQADVAIGDTTVHFDGVTTEPVAGDVFTVAGDTQTYTVLSVGTLATTDLDITFSPAAKVAWADDAAVTFKASHVVNLAFHRDAFGLAVRPLAPADGFTGGNEFRSAADELSGLSVSLEVSRQHMRTAWTWSILYGAKLIRPALATRIAG